jgi:Na+-driven multidrug efflux pump
MLVQSSIVSVNNSLVPEGTVYQPVVDGCAAGQNVGNFTYTAMEAVRHGTITFTSQNLGAKKPKRVYSVLGNSCLLVTLIGILFGYSIFFFHEPLLALYGVKDGAKGSLAHLAMEAATTQIKWNCLLYFLCGIMEVGSGTLRGLGFSFLSMMISLVGSCLLRVVWLLTVFPLSPTLDTIYLCYPITWVVTALTLLVFTLMRLKKIARFNGEV